VIVGWRFNAAAARTDEQHQENKIEIPFHNRVSSIIVSGGIAGRASKPAHVGKLGIADTATHVGISEGLHPTGKKQQIDPSSMAS
jgi:hypothetical protein